MEEEALRKMAIEQYLQDKDPVSIYREMGRSKKWFLNGFIDISRERRIGIGINPELLNPIPTRFLQRCKSLL